MDRCVGALKEEFAALRTGRASAGLLDQVHGGSLWLDACRSARSAPSACPNRARSRSASGTRALVVSVEKAIRNAGLGLNPVVEGQNLRIPVPPLTEERRRDLAKLAGKYAEQQRVAVRNVRRDAMDELNKAEKDAVITQDEHKRMEGEVQKLTDEAVRRVDEALKTKEQEIMQV